MANDPSHIANLLLRLHRGTLSDTDRQELEAWAASSAGNAALYRELTDEETVQAALREIERYDETPIRERILAQLPEAFSAVRKEGPPDVRLRTWRRTIFRWSAAAAIIILLGTGLWWLIWPKSPTVPVAQTTKPADIAAPAINRATLILASGQKVALDSIKSGQLATQGGTKIEKEANGQIAYIGTGGSAALLYNTLTNPRGSQVITLTLGDGTKVWLNAESSIRYPAVFIGAERTVEVTGEAYFEVAKDASKPFKVVIKDQEEVDVLGTKFNIHAYQDENVLKTTLLEGSVQVQPADGASPNQQRRSVVLRPGEQAELAENSNVVRMAGAVDTAAVMAWKNGAFAFEEATIKEVVRQLSRWYDVEVEYQGPVSSRTFSGEIGRNLTLSQVLHVLTKSHIPYRIENGNKLIIGSGD